MHLYMLVFPKSCSPHNLLHPLKKLGPAPRLLCSVPTSRTSPQRPLGHWAGHLDIW